MLVVDVSNVIHSGSKNGPQYLCGRDHSKSLIGIPYLFHKIANYAIKSENMVMAFDPDLEHDYSARVSHRKYSPQVVWELRVLKQLMDLIGVPTLQRKGVSADSWVHSVLTDFEDDDEDHYIVSVDQDLTCDVKRRGRYTTSTLAFNVEGYNYTPDSFERLSGVPYNFMNINKLLLGCSSDRIAVAEHGRKLYRSFLDWLSEITLMSSNGEFESVSDLYRVHDVFEYNTQEYFFKWLNEVEGRGDLEDVLRERAKEVFPKYQPTGLKSTEVNWVNWNSISRYLFKNNTLVFPKYGENPLNDAQAAAVEAILFNTPIITSTVFVPTSDFVVEDRVDGINDLLVLGGGIE